MDSIAEAKVKRFLTNRFHHSPHECGAICYNVNKLARKGGFDLNDRFARSGLAGGPEARIAAAVVAHALGTGGGAATSQYDMQNQLNRWVLTTPGMGY